MYAPFDLRFAAIVVPESAYINRLAPCAGVCRLTLQLIEERRPRVLVVQLGQLAHDLAAALVLELRHRDLDGHNLVAALAGVLGALHAPLPHAQLLSRSVEPSGG